MATSNELNDTLLDFLIGRTSILVTTSVAPNIEDPLVLDIDTKYHAFRTLLRDSLIERLQDLKPHLDTAIDAVEAEIDLGATRPASERHYVPETPTKFAGLAEQETP